MWRREFSPCEVVRRADKAEGQRLLLLCCCDSGNWSSNGWASCRGGPDSRAKCSGNGRHGCDIWLKDEGLGYLRTDESIQKGEKQKLEKEDELEMQRILVDCSPQARDGVLPQDRAVHV